MPPSQASPAGQYRGHLTAIACGDIRHTPPQATPIPSPNPTVLTSRNLPEPDPDGQDKNGDLEQVIATIHARGLHLVLARNLRGGQP